MTRIRLIIGLILAAAFVIAAIVQHAQAQQMGVGIRVPWVCADGTMFEAQGRCPKTIDPPVKIGPEERIRTMADAERIAREQR
jgi:hypothetical protein